MMSRWVTTTTSPNPPACAGAISSEAVMAKGGAQRNMPMMDLLFDQGAVALVERRFEEGMDLLQQRLCPRGVLKRLMRGGIVPDLDQRIEIRASNLLVGG